VTPDSALIAWWGKRGSQDGKQQRAIVFGGSNDAKRSGFIVEPTQQVGIEVL
jgi:hypothetical protein